MYDGRVKSEPLGSGSFAHPHLFTDLWENEYLEVWSKTLSGLNTRAMMFLNRTTQAARIVAYWNEVGLPTGPATVRDLWEQNDLGVYNYGYIANVPAHSVVLLEVSSTGSLP